MEDNYVTYIRTTAYQGKPILIDHEMGFIICPKLSEFDIFLYISRVTKFVDLYKENQESFFNLITSKDNITEFIQFALHFIDCEEYNFIENQFLFYSHDKKDVHILNQNNIDLFMGVIKVIHHSDDKKECVAKSKLAQQMLEELRKVREKVNKKAKSKDGISSLSVNLKKSPEELNSWNYFQIIQNFRMNNKIESWQVNMDALTSGNISKEDQGSIKHYTNYADDN